MAEERAREPRPMPEEMATVTPMMRGAYVPAWYSRLSWGSIFAGVFIALATQIILTAFVTWIGLVSISVSTVAALSDALATIGVWTAISAVVSLFVGAYAASRIGMVQYASDGLWHGGVVFAFTLIAGIVLSTLGTSGLLGFGANALVLLRGVLPSEAGFTAQDLDAILNNAGAAAGWFLLGSLLALGTALLGGWLGSRRQSRAEAMMAPEARERKVA